ncbi:hypothetical protein TPAR_05256 [Tolypocladium paradoxum]|uniref:Uncharacterized protein n=1 Tax=Tolypocladium paradoxum TaxID=94208 RepID=A0A2S4KWI1_9HYPO|nr:hypothetical protein TPAR_05256 [Tolypocladium paradoxum]
MKSAWTSSSLSSRARTSTSSSPLAPRSSPPSHLVVLAVPPPLLVLPLAAPLPKPRPKRRRRRRKSPTRIWVSVCSTKQPLTRNLHGYDAPRFFPEKLRAGCASVLACLWRGRIGCSWKGCRTLIRSAF